MSPLDIVAQKMKYTAKDTLLTAGLDVGSSAIKVAVMSDGPAGPKLLSGSSERIRRRDPGQVARGLFEESLRQAGVAEAEPRLRRHHGRGARASSGARALLRHGRRTRAAALFLDPEARAGDRHRRAPRPRDPDGSARQGARLPDDEPVRVGLGAVPREHLPLPRVTLEEIGPLSLKADAPRSARRSAPSSPRRT